MKVKKKSTVFVGLSGGVDSAVSAALLKSKGFDVVGVFIKTWHPEFIECNEEEERHDAIRVAAHLDIPFLTFDLSDEYKNGVGDYMIREYRAGRTPNPDVMCNKEIKFGAFLKKALLMGADFVATGHYAKTAPLQDFLLRNVNRSEGQFLLHKGKDPTKDQSYFLWTLNQEQLSKIIFPLGDLRKSDVRKLAVKFKLPVAAKKDSQGICFLGAVDLKEFLKHYIKPKKGKVLNEAGEVIGHHDGAVFHTLGERHGFTITVKGPSDSRYYVISKDIKKNTITVSQNKNLGVGHPSASSASKEIHIKDINWIGEIPEVGREYSTQIRYHGELLSCTFKKVSKTAAQLIFNKPVLVAPGQSCVVYDGDLCLGGGVVE